MHLAIDSSGAPGKNTDDGFGPVHGTGMETAPRRPDIVPTSTTTVFLPRLWAD
jgi:hypothetical protein